MKECMKSALPGSVSRDHSIEEASTEYAKKGGEEGDPEWREGRKWNLQYSARGLRATALSVMENLTIGAIGLVGSQGSPGRTELIVLSFDEHLPVDHEQPHQGRREYR